MEGKKKFAGSQEIANGDNIRLNNTDILVACIDGDVLPAGTCAEIGKFHEKIERGDHKYIVGICTDNRQMHLTHSKEKDEGGASSLGEQQYSYQNLYVTGLIKQVGVLVSNIDDAIKFMKKVAPEFMQEYVDDYHPESVDDYIYNCVRLAKEHSELAKGIHDTNEKLKTKTLTTDDLNKMSFPDMFKDLLDEEEVQYSNEH